MKGLGTSKRTFAVSFTEYGNFTNEKITIQEIAETSKGDFEWIYAMQDSIDDILDLKVNQTILFDFNRDNKLATGFIRRIK